MNFVVTMLIIFFGGMAGLPGMSGLSVFAQPAYFQGSLVYRVTVKSRFDDLSDRDAHKILTIGDLLTVTVKEGNYKLSTEYADTYVIKDDKKQYIKFRKIDTVFYLDFSSDTSRVTGIVKDNTVVKVGGYPCRAITIETGKVSRQYYYSTDLRTNPDDDRQNGLAQANLYARETDGALRLWTRTEYPYATETDSCIRVEPRPIDDQAFRLPDLPIAELFSSSRIFFPRFPGGEKAWAEYTAAKLNPKLTARWVKIPKGEVEAWQTVILQFTVAEDGSISDITVVNGKEVNPKLAEEAIRVMRQSPKWLPATFYGEKVKWTVQEGVEFRALK